MNGTADGGAMRQPAALAPWTSDHGDYVANDTSAAIESSARLPMDARRIRTTRPNGWARSRP
jgi:hypothetical protein